MDEREASELLCTATRFRSKRTSRKAIRTLLCDMDGVGRLRVLQHALIYSILMIEVDYVWKVPNLTPEIVRSEVARLLGRTCA